MGNNAIPVTLLLSDRVLDRTLDTLTVRAGLPKGTDSLGLARWDLKGALVDALRREGLDIDVRRCS